MFNRYLAIFKDSEEELKISFLESIDSMFHQPAHFQAMSVSGYQRSISVYINFTFREIRLSFSSHFLPWPSHSCLPAKTNSDRKSKRAALNDCTNPIHHTMRGRYVDDAYRTIFSVLSITSHSKQIYQLLERQKRQVQEDMEVLCGLVDGLRVHQQTHGCRLDWYGLETLVLSIVSSESNSLLD